MPIFAQQKRTVLAALGGPNNHLYFVCNDPDPEGKVVALNCTSWESDRDDSTCMLEAGCHPFIKHKSYILYRRAGWYLASYIDECIANGQMHPHEPCDDILFARIVAGIGVSPHTPRKIKTWFAALHAAQ